MTGRIPYWAVLTLLAYMPFHIFLSQSLSLATGGLEVWKVAKDVFLAIVVVFTICIVLRKKRATKLFYWLFGLTLAYVGLHFLLWITHADLYSKGAILGVVYNTRLPCFMLLGYGARLLYPGKFVFSSFMKVLLVVSTTVVCLGILQYLLPKDILTHLGYGLDRGVRSAFFIDDKPYLPRIMSTLREPNALGAYLVLPLAALSLYIFRARTTRRRWQLAGLFVLHAAALFLTYSRSAWLGAALAIGLVVWWQYSSLFIRFLRKGWPTIIAVLLLLTLAGVTQRNNQFVQSTLTHSTPETVQDIDSNQYHWLLVRQGIEGVADQPFGHGPGTAGIVSIQNPTGGLLTENYYVQIAYEVGLAGLALFIALSVLVYWGLYRRRDHVAAILLASFWAYVVTNMLLHTWSNEAVAAQWWMFAGLGLAPISLRSSETSASTKKHATS